MCKFHSSISDGKGNVLFFKPGDIIDIMPEGNPKSCDFNSHSQIGAYSNLNGIMYDRWNKWEYDPKTKVRYFTSHHEVLLDIAKHKIKRGDNMDDLKELFQSICSAEKDYREALKKANIGELDYLKEDICETAPYPQCNGAERCDTCEHQQEDN